MGCDNWKHAEMRQRTDERVALAVAEMEEADEPISPWRITQRCGVRPGSVEASLLRMGIEWTPLTYEEAGSRYRTEPPTPDEIRERAVAEWVGRHESDVIDLAEAVAALVDAKASRVVPDIMQRAGRLRRARHRLFCAIGGSL